MGQSGAQALRVNLFLVQNSSGGNSGRFRQVSCIRACEFCTNDGVSEKNEVIKHNCLLQNSMNISYFSSSTGDEEETGERDIDRERRKDDLAKSCVEKFDEGMREKVSVKNSSNSYQCQWCYTKMSIHNRASVIMCAKCM